MVNVEGRSENVKNDVCCFRLCCNISREAYCFLLVKRGKARLLPSWFIFPWLVWKVACFLLQNILASLLHLLLSPSLVPAWGWKIIYCFNFHGTLLPWFASDNILCRLPASALGTCVHRGIFIFVSADEICCL